MNNRDYKKFAPNCYYHIYNRGNAKMDIFSDEQDYFNFLKRVKIVLGFAFPTTKAPFGGQRAPLSRITPLPKDMFTVICYCLMPNHFHLLMRQNTELPLSKLMLKLCGSYSKYFNLKYERVGSLFQDQYKMVLMENDSQLLWLSAYIHNNPIVAGLVKKTEVYQWSSYPDYLDRRNGTLCEKNIILEQFADVAAYQKFVEGSLEKIKARKELEHLLLDE